MSEQTTENGRVSDNLNSMVWQFEDGCLELEREITLKARIGWQDRKWHLFRDSGDAVTKGANSLLELICSLSPNVCGEPRNTNKGD